MRSNTSKGNNKKCELSVRIARNSTQNCASIKTVLMAGSLVFTREPITGMMRRAYTSAQNL